MGPSWESGKVRWNDYPQSQIYYNLVAAYAGGAMGNAMADNENETFGRLLGLANPFQPKVGQILNADQSFNMFPVSVVGPYQIETTVGLETEFSAQFNTFREYLGEDGFWYKISEQINQVVITRYIVTGTGRLKFYDKIVIGRPNGFSVS